MQSTLSKLGLMFAAGAVGGIATNVINLTFGLVNIPAAVGVDLTQDLSIAYLYADLFWGGIWGFLFLIPVLNQSLLLKGAVLSAIPTLAQIFIEIPSKAGTELISNGFTAFELIYILILNLVWGLFAALFIMYTKQGQSG